MFFGNKKIEEEENLIKEIVVKDEKEDTFVISDYAMERYKKSDHYNQVDLTNKEIELLFCEKKDWQYDGTKSELFVETLEKLTTMAFDHLVFPYIKIKKNSDHLHFKNCIFYGGCNLNEEAKNLQFKDCTFSTFFSIDVKDSIKLSNVESTQMVIENCKKLEISNSKIDSLSIPKYISNDENELRVYIENSKINDFHGLYHSNLNLIIHSSELTFSEFFPSLEAKNIKIYNSKIDKLNIYNTQNIVLSQSTFQSLNLSNSDIEDIFIGYSTVENECIFTHLKNKDICVLQESTFKKGVDFRFASINKLAIYKSDFKELDFDCSFIEQARFSQLKGLNEENEIEELSEKHFASKDSLKFFEKVTKK